MTKEIKQTFWNAEKKFACRHKHTVFIEKTRRKNCTPKFLSHKILSVAHTMHIDYVHNHCYCCCCCCDFALSQHDFVTKILSRLLFYQQQKDSPREQSCMHNIAVHLFLIVLETQSSVHVYCVVCVRVCDLESLNALFSLSFFLCVFLL